MKKKSPLALLTIIIISLITLLSGCCKDNVAELEKPDPELMAKYPENVMPYQDAANIPEFDSQNFWSKNKIYNYRATVNTIFRNCNVPLTDAEYETTQNMLQQPEWTEIESPNHDVNSETTIAISSLNGAPCYIFPDDTALLDALEVVGQSYQMPAGTYEQVRIYLEAVYEAGRQKALDTTDYFANLMAGDFILEWRMIYEQPHYSATADRYLHNDVFTCWGTPELAQEIQAAMGDTTQWSSLDLTENSYLFHNVNFSPAKFPIYISQGNGNRCEIFPANDDGTYISVKNYAIFYTPENIYDSIMVLLKQHQEEWYIIYLEE